MWMNTSKTINTSNKTHPNNSPSPVCHQASHPLSQACRQASHPPSQGSHPSNPSSTTPIHMPPPLISINCSLSNNSHHNNNSDHPPIRTDKCNRIKAVSSIHSISIIVVNSNRILEWIGEGVRAGIGVVVGNSLSMLAVRWEECLVCRTMILCLRCMISHKALR